MQLFKERLLNPEGCPPSIVLTDYTPFSVEEVVRRGVHRIRPASDKGEELRDVVTWFFVIEYAKKCQKQVVLITNDGDFRDGDNFHPDLVEDIRKNKIDVLLWRTLWDFVKDNALSFEDINPQQTQLVIPEAEIIALITTTFKQRPLEEGTVEFVNLPTPQFQSATKYKIDETSFYIEADYEGVAYLSITEHYVTSLLNLRNTRNILIDSEEEDVPSHSASAYRLTKKVGRDGEPYFTAETLSVIPKSVYEARYKAKLSARLVAGKTESTEVIQFHFTLKQKSRAVSPK